MRTARWAAVSVGCLWLWEGGREGRTSCDDDRVVGGPEAWGTVGPTVCAALVPHGERRGGGLQVVTVVGTPLEGRGHGYGVVRAWAGPT